MEADMTTPPATAAKLSFSFSSSSSRPSASSRPTSSNPQSRSRSQQPMDVNGGGDDARNRQYVTVFDASQTLASADGGPVIAPIPNADLRNTTRKMKKLPLPSEADDDPAAAAAAGTRFVLDTSTGDAPASNIPYGLTVRSNNSTADAVPRIRANENGRDSRRNIRSAPDDDFMLRRYRDDMEDLPDDRGEEEFKDIEVEDFAAAVLRGYGWLEGQVIGQNKNLPEPKLFEYKRKGGTEGLGYNPEAGDPKKKKGNWVVQEVKEKRDFGERIVRVISGQLKGSKGKVLRNLGTSEVVIKLLESGEEVRLQNDMVIKSDTAEEESFLRNSNRREKHDKDGRTEVRRSRDKRSWERKSGHASHQTWLRSHIRVRIISKDFMGGRLYLKKGVIIDVVGPTTCDISIDGSRELVQGVDQDILETALPKKGGSVLVLYGKYKNVFGSLEERNSENGTGIVRHADSHALINVQLDEIAEYTGDPSELGY